MCQKWICITDKLPESNKKVIISYVGKIGNKRKTVMGMLVSKKSIECNCNDYDCGCEFDEELGISHFPEGWYELSENGEYNYIPIYASIITHWMRILSIPK